MKQWRDPLLNWLHLPGSRESFDDFHGFVLEQARDADLPEALTARIDLVLEEILLNVIYYACTSSKEEKVEVGCGEVPGKGFLVRIIDPGPPFNPLEKSRPDTTLSIDEREIGGLGILLAKELSSAMVYHRHHNRNILDVYFQTPLSENH